MPAFFIFLLLVVGVTARPPITKDEMESMQPVELEYLEDLIAPWLVNSTKIKENMLYEKKKYLSTVLGQHSKRGNEVYNLLQQKGRNIPIRVIDNDKIVAEWKTVDFKELAKTGYISRKSIDSTTGLLQHAKMIVVDGKHTLITSSNMDHLSLNSKVELGLLISNCPCFAEDATQIFDNFWNGRTNLEKTAKYNSKQPLTIGSTEIYTAMSGFREFAREDDLLEMCRLVREAENFVNISVMDFSSTADFPVEGDGANIDCFTDEIFIAVKRGISVNVLVSDLTSKRRNNREEFWRKLQLQGVNLKVLKFPTDEVMTTRRLHSKYFVTDKAGIISTSNFTPDYFYHDTGLAVVIKEKNKNILSQMEENFNWHWNSIYSNSFTVSE